MLTTPESAETILMSTEIKNPYTLKTENDSLERLLVVVVEPKTAWYQFLMKVRFTLLFCFVFCLTLTVAGSNNHFTFYVAYCHLFAAHLISFSYFSIPWKVKYKGHKDKFVCSRQTTMKHIFAIKCKFWITSTITV